MINGAWQPIDVGDYIFVPPGEEHAIAILRMLAGLNPSPELIGIASDINEDGLIGLPEVVYALQSAAGMH